MDLSDFEGPSTRILSDFEGPSTRILSDLGGGSKHNVMDFERLGGAGIILIEIDSKKSLEENKLFCAAGTLSFYLFE